MDNQECFPDGHKCYNSSECCSEKGCVSGRCQADIIKCNAHRDCPQNIPVCDFTAGHCVACGWDSSPCQHDKECCSELLCDETLKQCIKPECSLGVCHYKGECCDGYFCSKLSKRCKKKWVISLYVIFPLLGMLLLAGFIFLIIWFARRVRKAESQSSSS
jgi:hypothetical protein